MILCLAEPKAEEFDPFFDTQPSCTCACGGCREGVLHCNVDPYCSVATSGYTQVQRPRMDEEYGSCYMWVYDVQHI
jgi:hypothetical protein